MARRDYSGNAKPAILAGGISATDLTIVLNDATGWPSGGPAGKFFMTLGTATSTEERVLVESRTGTTLTIASIADRGVDDTLAASHDPGVTAEHTYSGLDADEANAHIWDTGRDDHTQYLNLTRHTAVSHLIGTHLPTPGSPANVGTVASAGVSTSAARADHVHDTAAGFIDLSDKFVAGVVDTAALANLAITTGKLAADAVTNAKLADDAVQTENIQDDAITQALMGLLSVGTSELIDAAVTALKLAPNSVTATAILNGTISVAKMSSEAFTSYVPTLTNITLGGGSVTGRYIKVGRIVAGQFQFTLGATGNVTGNPIIGVPFQCAVTPAADWFCGARAINPATGGRAAGVGLVSAGDSVAGGFATFGIDLWDNAIPWDWTTNSQMWGFFFYEAVT